MPLTTPQHGDWILLGLMFDVCGSLVLAAGLVFKRLTDARYESLTIAGGNSALVRGAMLQEGDAVAGILLLATGFVLQAWGNFHAAGESTSLGWIRTGPRAAISLCVVAVISVGTRQVLQELARRSFYRYGFRAWRPNQPAYTVRPTEPDYPDRQAWSLNEKRRPHETDEQLLARLTQVRDRLGRKYGPAYRANKG